LDVYANGCVDDLKGGYGVFLLERLAVPEPEGFTSKEASVS
jgi:hypothetical protein